jgi:excisionase family DNA binding protein
MKKPLAPAALTVQPSTSDPHQGLWTVGQVAQFLGVSKRWVHERTRRNEIPCYRLGTALRFDPEEIRTWAAKFHHLPEEG